MALYFPLLAVISNAWGTDSMPGEYVSDHRFELDAAGSDEPDGVFQMRRGADVGKQVTQTAFAQQIDINGKGLAKPGHADDLAAGPDRVDGLRERLDPESPCRGLPPAHSKTTSAPLPSVRSRIAAPDRLDWR